jgi:transcriptional regulator
MYNPQWFKEERVEVLQRAIETISFGTFVTSGKSGLLASHIPMMVERSEGAFGTIQGHLARGNNQWRDTNAGSHALAMFVGPHAYISPSWYQTHRDDGKVVPTWNYIAIHASGRPVFFDDAERLLRFVTKLTVHFEDTYSSRWSVADSPEDYVASQLKAIIGFEMPIESLEGKWKLGQNRPEADRKGAIEGLRNRAAGRDLEVSDEMDATLKGK